MYLMPCMASTGHHQLNTRPCAQQFAVGSPGAGGRFVVGGAGEGEGEGRGAGEGEGEGRGAGEGEGEGRGAGVREGEGLGKGLGGGERGVARGWARERGAERGQGRVLPGTEMVGVSWECCIDWKAPLLTGAVCLLGTCRWSGCSMLGAAWLKCCSSRCTGSEPHTLQGSSNTMTSAQV